MSTNHKSSSAYTPFKPDVHRACGGGVSCVGLSSYDGRPVFQCSKCQQTWTCGQSGGKWAKLVTPNLRGLDQT